MHDGQVRGEGRKNPATGLDGDHDPAVVLQEEAGIVRDDTRLVRLSHIGEDHVHHADEHSSAMGVHGSRIEVRRGPELAAPGLGNSRGDSFFAYILAPQSKNSKLNPKPYKTAATLNGKHPDRASVALWLSCVLDNGHHLTSNCLTHGSGCGLASTIPSGTAGPAKRAHSKLQLNCFRALVSASCS